MCLNQVCYYADVALGQACVVENLAFVGFKDVDGKSQQFSDVRSKDNCKYGGYCDGSQRICLKTLNVGEACSADKTCSSFNCGQDGKCIPPTDGADSPPVWVYVVVGVGIIASTCRSGHARSPNPRLVTDPAALLSSDLQSSSAPWLACTLSTDALERSTRSSSSSTILSRSVHLSSSARPPSFPTLLC